MIEKWKDTEDEKGELQAEYDELEEEYAKARAELAKPHISERWRDMVEKIEAILYIPAKSHEINVTITDTDYKVDCFVKCIGEEETEM